MNGMKAKVVNIAKVDQKKASYGDHIVIRETLKPASKEECNRRCRGKERLGMSGLKYLRANVLGV